MGAEQTAKQWHKSLRSITDELTVEQRQEVSRMLAAGQSVKVSQMTRSDGQRVVTVEQGVPNA